MSSPLPPIPCPSLTDLPAPPPGRTGWPWTEGTPARESTRLAEAWPLITVVTPSYNQGQFIEETIRSVLLQGYPRLEYLILDGGSSDETVAIIRKYEPWISFWVSERDGGQTAALNRGFRMARGELIGWQNSDDYYYPGALLAGAEAARADSQADVIFGENPYVDAQSKFICNKEVRPPTPEAMIPWPCISNQAMFMRRRIFESGTFLDEGFRHYMDYEFFWRLILAGRKFAYCRELAGALRTHENAKGVALGAIAQGEGFQIYRWLLGEKSLPTAAHAKLLGALRTECLNDFGHHRLSTYRQHVRELVQDGGWSQLTPGLIVRWVLSLLGERFTRLVVNR